MYRNRIFYRKVSWLKRTIEVMLSNEEYAGNVHLLDYGKHDFYYKVEGNNPVIISAEICKATQIEKRNLSNVVEGVEGSWRKSKKYSSKQ